MPENGSQCNRRWWMGKNEMALVGYVQRCNGNDAAHRGDGIYKPRRAEAARGTNATRACDARSLVSGVHKRAVRPSSLERGPS